MIVSSIALYSSKAQTCRMNQATQLLTPSHSKAINHLKKGSDV